jgi:DNA-binding SARP family transcriptional activator/tetratricopeptide (TPR) repeat protein
LRLCYRILGEFTMWDGEQQVPLPRGTRLAVLGVLLLNANRRMSTADLLRAGWGRIDMDETQLHKCVSELRALLAKVGRRDALETHPHFGYELKVAEDELDKLVFERLVREAEDAGWESRVEDEVRLLREAVRLWRGPHALAGLPAASVRQDAADLELRRKRAAVRLFELEMARGRYERILDEVATVFSYHPSDRRLCEQLMIVLYRSGHASEAVDAFERYRLALDESTGGQPEPALRNLMYAIASADEPVIARYVEALTQEPVDAPRTAVIVPPRQLPPDLADFVGREDAVGEARWLLTREPSHTVPVVVAFGPGGMGKTALVVHVAHLVRDRYPDGQLYVELRGTSDQPADPAEVLGQVLRAFGVANVPEERAERVALYRSMAADRRLLVVLDDARDEEQVRDLIPGIPTCSVLISARKRLPDIDGAHHLPPLEPLAETEATDLYARVVSRSDIDATTEPAATKRIIELCAGLPLALCVAGALRARDHSRTGAELAERLAHQRPEAFVYNERSVARSIGAGFERLDRYAQLLFLGLGLLRLPDFGLWTAAAVLDGTEADPAESLLHLASWQMLQPTGGGMRFTLHDLTRDYARRRAEAAYPDPAARRAVQERVYAALLTLARRAHRGLYGGDFEVVHGEVPDWAAPDSVLAEVDRSPLSWFEQERAGIRAAVAHTAALGFTEICWDLAVSAHEFYTIRRYHDDWHATHQTALAACRTAGDLRGEAAVLASLGQPTLAASRGTGVSTPEDLHRATDLFATAKDRHGEAIALRTLANTLLRHGQPAAALELFERALAGYTESGDTVGRSQALRFIGQTHLELGSVERALAALQDAERVAATLPPRLLAQTRYSMGRARVAAGDLDGARAEFAAVLALIGETEHSGSAHATFGLGDVARRAGDRPEAERHLQDAAELAHGAGDSALEGRAYLTLADLYHEDGQPDRQIRTLNRAVAVLRGSDSALLQATALNALGDAQAAAGAHAAARTAWIDAGRLYAAIGRPEADAIAQKLG